MKVYDSNGQVKVKSSLTGVQSVVAGTNVTVNNGDPDNPIVSSNSPLARYDNSLTVTITETDRVVWCPAATTITMPDTSSLTVGFFVKIYFGTLGAPSDVTINDNGASRLYEFTVADDVGDPSNGYYTPFFVIGWNGSSWTLLEIINLHSL